MPMVATSPSTWTYSWVLAYLLSSGYVAIVFSPSLRPFVEGRRHDASAGLVPADQYEEFGPWRRLALRKICETDRLFQCRRVRAAGDDADLFLRLDHGIAVPGDAAVDHFEAHQLPARTFGLFAL